jgi:putative transposase
MDVHESLSHTKWDCKYHVVFIPMPDHVHMMISIPPKYAVSQVVGFIKGKSAIHLARSYGERIRNFVGQHFWARGYFVSTVGRDEQMIREYIRNQEKEDQRLDQLNMWR